MLRYKAFCESIEYKTLSKEMPFVEYLDEVIKDNQDSTEAQFRVQKDFEDVLGSYGLELLDIRTNISRRLGNKTIFDIFLKVLFAYKGKTYFLDLSSYDTHRLYKLINTEYQNMTTINDVLSRKEEVEIGAGPDETLPIAPNVLTNNVVELLKAI